MPSATVVVDRQVRSTNRLDLVAGSGGTLQLQRLIMKLVCVVLLMEICFIELDFLAAGQQECPALRRLVEPGRRCRKPCETDRDCRGILKRCLCDDKCGMSCFNPNATCHELLGIANGRVVHYPGRKYGERATYSCNDGFYLDGDAYRKCRSDKRWSGATPKCIGYGECGRANAVHRNFARIIGGISVNHTAWPWQALITKQSSRRTLFERMLGGGSLINQEWVLTAAHIFDHYRDVKDIARYLVVAVGIFRKPRFIDQLDPNVKLFRPSKVHLHPRFNRRNRYRRTDFDHDVALIRVGVSLRPARSGPSWILSSHRPKFNGTIPLSPYVRPVCLPCSNSCMPIENFVDDNGNRIINDNDSNDVACLKKGRWLTDRYPRRRGAAIVTGFGYTNVSTRAIPEYLQQATLSLLPDILCRAAIEHTLRYTDRMICARSPRNARQPADSCTGDSGGPLIRQYRDPDSGRSCWIQIGIVSFGVGCAHRRASGFQDPGYYTDVAKMQGWIEQTVRDDLRPCTENCEEVTVTSPRTGLSTLPTPETILAPVNLVLNDVTRSSFVASWEPGPGSEVEHYKVSIGPLLYPQGDKYYSFITSSPRFYASGLEGGRTYVFRVVAVSGLQTSPEVSDIVTTINEVCLVEGVWRAANEKFYKRNPRGYMQNCTCFRKIRGGRWRCKPIVCLVDGRKRTVDETWVRRAADGIRMEECTCHLNREIACFIPVDRVLVRVRNSRMRNYVGGTATLHCMYDKSIPGQPLIKWYKWRQGEWGLIFTYDVSTRYQQIKSSFVTSNDSSVLNISNLRVSDAGNYECRVTYPTKTGKGRTRIVVDRKPTPVTFTSPLKSPQGGEYTLQWEVEPNQQLHSFQLHARRREAGSRRYTTFNIPGEARAFQFLNLKPGRTYEGFMTATTAHGISRAKKFRFTTAESAPEERAITSVRVQATAFGQLLEWQSEGRTVQSWKIVVLPEHGIGGYDVILPRGHTRFVLRNLQYGVPYVVKIYPWYGEVYGQPQIIRIPA